CLKSPLASVSIKLCQLSKSELEILSWCQRLFQLKHLNLCAVPLFNLSPTHLQFLLENVAYTLQTLKVNFYDNGISTSLLKDLLQSMANINMLTEEFYPAPLECYNKMGHILMDKFANLCSDLLNILRSKIHSKKVSFGTEICRVYFQSCVYDLKTRLCHCHKQELSLQRLSRMSFETPSTLLGLAVKTLLRNEDFAISVLQQVPMELFPSLFKEAFNSRCMKILTAMVASWTFVCLLVGAMMKVPDVVVLQAVISGIAMLLTKNVHLRRSKFRVLYLRKGYNHFLDVWAGLEGVECSVGMLSKEQKGYDFPKYALKRPLRVVTDFDLKAELDEQQTYLLQWAQQQKRSVKINCKKMTICETPVELIKTIMKTFLPDSMKELELSTN
ncbi:hypothetical protein U0070_025656, partial [Myodes glareolus]